MASGAAGFTLSAALGGHDNEVRAVAAVGDTVFTGAQDRMLYAWTLVDGVRARPQPPIAALVAPH